MRPEGRGQRAEGRGAGAPNLGRMGTQAHGRRAMAGFTLIEMLTVIAIMAVLMTIIVEPLFQSFNLTRAGEAFADAQDQGRYLTEKIAREIGNAVSVRAGGALIATTLNGNAVSLPNSSIVVEVPGVKGSTPAAYTGPNGTTYVDAALSFAKLDLIPPAQGQDPAHIGAAGSYINPITGKIDPTLKAPRGQVGTPVTPSKTMVRYWVGLRDPFSPYNDPYTGLLMTQAGGRDNLYVLYRAEVVPSLTVATGTGQQPNTALFNTDANGNLVLDDPRFFVADRTNTGAIAQDDHNLRIYHWMGQTAPWEGNDPVKDNVTNFAHSSIQTQDSRYDMILPVYNLANRAVTYDNNIPRLIPLVQFRSTVVSNDPSAGQEALRQGDEADNAAAIAPDVYKTQYGLWNTAVIRTFTEGYAPGNPYLIGYNSLSGAPGFSIYAYNPNSGAEFAVGTELFDDYTYDNAKALGYAYPFTAAAMAASARSGWLGQNSVFPMFTPYHVLTGPGKIVASFDISEVGTNSLPTNPYLDPSRPNLPAVQFPYPYNFASPTAYNPNSPTNDPDYNATTNTWSGNFVWSPVNATTGNPYDPNEAFNQAWWVHQDLQGNLQRFIDMRVVPNEDGTYGPLYPGHIAGTVTGFQVPDPSGDGGMLSHCRIVPGTEIIYGPDQNPGPNYGHAVRYSRVMRGNPGPDQYRINYVDQKEPTDATGHVTAAAYQNMLNPTGNETTGFNPDTYDPTNFCSATIQPRYKAGYIQLNSDPNDPLPNGYVTAGGYVPVPFRVEYRFQFTGTVPTPAGGSTSDVFAVDYDTRQLMQVLLTIRNYPQSNLPNPQSITLKATAAVRNYAR